MNYLFKRKITDWKSWGEVFQSIDAFRELIKEIFVKEELLGYEKISNLTPGTNAVFRVGDYVVKIFAPKESGANTECDYDIELKAMNMAINKGINAPKVVAASSIKDKYLFKYIIMEYLNGEEAGKVLKRYSYNEKIKFVNNLKLNLKKLNSKPLEKINSNLVIERALNNKRWDKCSNEVKKQIHGALKNYKISQYVYVHGDITSDNVMVNNQGDLFIIDFADSVIAPLEYEWPPILFDLFDFDEEMIKEFIKGMNYDEFIEKLFMAILLHEFGVYFVEIIYKKYRGKEIQDLKDINEIKEVIKNGIR